MTDKKFLKQVTVTGADDSVNYYDLYDISRQFSFVEWGVLLSKNSEGYPRFPTLKWLEGFMNEEPLGVHVSGHLCGTWVRDLVSGGSQFLSDYYLNDTRRDLFYRFERLQLNFHGTKHILSLESFARKLGLLTVIGKQQVVFQMDGVNDDIYYYIISLGKNSGINAVALFDLSGGQGELPKEWQGHLGDYCGYAGGLSSDNLVEQLGKIEKKITPEGKNPYPIWIDAETHLRSPDNLKFDLGKVVKFLEIAKPYVIGE